MWQVANLRARPLVGADLFKEVQGQLMEWQARRWVEVYVRIVAPVLGHEFTATIMRHPDLRQVTARLLEVINRRRIRIDIRNGKVVVTELGAVVHTYRGRIS